MKTQKIIIYLLLAAQFLSSSQIAWAKQGDMPLADASRGTTSKDASGKVRPSVTFYFSGEGDGDGSSPDKGDSSTKNGGRDAEIRIDIDRSEKDAACEAIPDRGNEKVTIRVRESSWSPDKNRESIDKGDARDRAAMSVPKVDVLVFSPRSDVENAISRAGINYDSDILLWHQALFGAVYGLNRREAEKFDSEKQLAVNELSQQIDSMERQNSTFLSEVENVSAELGQNAQKLVASPQEKGASQPRPLQAPADSDFGRRERIVQNKLLSLDDQAPQLSAIKETGLDYVASADTAYVGGETSTAEAFLELAAALAEIGLQISAPQTAIAFWARDVYEALTGRSLLTGAPLDSLSLNIAVLGAVTFGFGDEFAKLGKSAMKFFGRAGRTQKIGAQISKLATNPSLVPWKLRPEVLPDLRLAVDSIMSTGKLPERWVTKEFAASKGWVSKSGNLNEVLPGKSIGGDVYRNKEGLLPPGLAYLEADLGYVRGHRAPERIVWSMDGTQFYLWDHIETFIDLDNLNILRK